MDKNYVKRIKEEIKISLGKKLNQSISHGEDHGYRVWKRAKFLATHIMKTENIEIDLEILEIASRIHDIDQSYQEEKIKHVKNSMTESESIMIRVGYPERSKVLEILSEHSSELVKTPSSIEAKILFDADKLDGLGAIGIARVFALCGQRGMTIKQTVRWYRNKINMAMPLMETEIGKKIAMEELKYVNSFLEKIEKEEDALINQQI